MVVTLDLIIDYGGNSRFASLTRLDWFDSPPEDWGVRYQEYELVTQGFLDAFKLRLDTQEARKHGYTKTMLHRLELAKRLYFDLTAQFVTNST